MSKENSGPSLHAGGEGEGEGAQEPWARQRAPKSAEGFSAPRTHPQDLNAGQPYQNYADRVLHLLCQGLEITLKGLLLLREYDQYKPRLRGIGHDLCRAASEASIAFGLRTPDGNVAAELKELSNLYSRHLMRYSSVVDIFIDPRSIQWNKVLRRILAAIRIAERELKRGAMSGRGDR